jgi:L-alanine-DL-glutamate epimerase-like enolase superfamily enzyme
MRVTAVETWLLRMPYHPEAAAGPGETVELPGVFLHTDGGTRGLGFAYSLNGGGAAVCELVEACLTPIVSGAAPADRVALWERMAGATRRLGAGPMRLAIAAVDIALWDLAARDLGLPLHRLLGTRRAQVPLFSSGRYSPALPVERLISNAHEDIARGATAVKLRIGGREPAEDLERVAAVREALGSEVELLVDAAELLTLAQARWLCPRFEALDVRCFEEPLPTELIDHYRLLRASTSIPIAAGEHLATRPEFLAYLRAEALDVINPDVAVVGGVTEFMRICELADAFGCAVAPHLVTDLHVALGPAIPGLLYVEAFPFTGDLWDMPDQAHGAALPASTRPGLGLEFAPTRFEACRVR